MLALLNITDKVIQNSPVRRWDESFRMTLLCPSMSLWRLKGTLPNKNQVNQYNRHLSTRGDSRHVWIARWGPRKVAIMWNYVITLRRFLPYPVSKCGTEISCKVRMSSLVPLYGWALVLNAQCALVRGSIYRSAPHSLLGDTFCVVSQSHSQLIFGERRVPRRPAGCTVPR